MDIHQCRVFIHDGDPCLRSRIVSVFLKNQKVEALQSSENSPDLNFVENPRKIFKNIVAEKKPAFAKQLVDVIKKSLGH